MEAGESAEENSRTQVLDAGTWIEGRTKMYSCTHSRVKL
jgi:hypothetical protein